MKCGHLQAIRVTNNGYGLLLMLRQKKSWDVMSEKGIRTEQKDSGNHFRRYIVSVLSVIRISGRHMGKYFLQSGIVLFRNRAEKQAVLRGSVIQ